VIRAANIPGGDSVLAETIRRIVAAIDPVRIIVSGWRARGDAGPEGDYDLLVVMASDARRRELEQTAYTALVGVLPSVDLLVETPQRLERLRHSVAAVHADALREGKVVYERCA
jgi:predicted nucleotidyltransferase